MSSVKKAAKITKNCLCSHRIRFPCWLYCCGRKILCHVLHIYKIWCISLPRLLRPKYADSSSGNCVSITIYRTSIMGNSIQHILINPNQMRHFGTVVQDNPMSDTPICITQRMISSILNSRYRELQFFWNSYTDWYRIAWLSSFNIYLIPWMESAWHKV